MRPVLRDTIARGPREPDAERYVSVGRASHQTAIAPGRLFAALRSGELSGIVGPRGRWYVDRRSLARYSASIAADTAPPAA